jgi:hypothetical protein
VQVLDEASVFFFLSHVISEEGMSLDSSKIQDTLSWNTPVSVADVQSFHGLVGYCLRFVEGFSKVTKPMIELLEKNKKFKLTPAYEVSF